MNKQFKSWFIWTLLSEWMNICSLSPCSTFLDIERSIDAYWKALDVHWDRFILAGVSENTQQGEPVNCGKATGMTTRKEENVFEEVTESCERLYVRSWTVILVVLAVESLQRFCIFLYLQLRSATWV